MAYQLHAGEVKRIQWFPNLPPPAPPPASPVNLTGLAVTMLWQGPAASPSWARKTATMTVAGDGLSASYTTLATDFPEPGVYKFQWWVGTGPLMSDVVEETVGSSLT